MIRFPTAVDPVKEMRSTSPRKREILADQVVRRRDDVQHPGRDVGLLGRDAAEQRGVPGRVGRRLEHDGVPRGERLGQLRDGDLERVVPRHDRPDHADRLFHDAARVGVAPEIDRVGEVGLPGVVVDELRRVGECAVEGSVELWSGRQHAGAADLEDELLTHLLPLGVEGGVELLEATPAQGPVG